MNLTQSLYDAAGNLVQLNLLGDCDCDGRVTDYDVDTLVYAIQYGEQAWIGLFGTTAPCPFSNLDLNGDGTVDGDDHDPNNPLINGLVGAQLPAASRFVYDEECPAFTARAS